MACSPGADQKRGNIWVNQNISLNLTRQKGMISLLKIIIKKAFGRGEIHTEPPWLRSLLRCAIAPVKPRLRQPLAEGRALLTG